MDIRYILPSTYNKNTRWSLSNVLLITYMSMKYQCVHDSIGKHFSLTVLRFVEYKLTVLSYPNESVHDTIRFFYFSYYWIIFHRSVCRYFFDEKYCDSHIFDFVSFIPNPIRLKFFERTSTTCLYLVVILSVSQMFESWGPHDTEDLQFNSTTSLSFDLAWQIIRCNIFSITNCFH